MDKNPYDILPTKANLHSYNRYPFGSFSEAVNNMKQKSLQPGEIAIAYYFDNDSILGINAVLGIGNLKNAQNIIFTNSEQKVNDISKKVFQQTQAINQLVEVMNNTSKTRENILKRLDALEEKFNCEQ